MYILYSDGGSRGNPGPGACAYCIYTQNLSEKAQLGVTTPDYSKGIYLGITTNNQAEWKGLLHGIECILNLDSNPSIQSFLDSELVVKQVNGIYKVKDAQLKQLLAHYTELKKRCRSISVSHVYREQNALADALVNDTLDKYKNYLP